MIFDSWSAVARVILMGIATYVALIFLLRTSGKRTLSKMNMFDYVITVALGSTFATIILSKDVALVEGVVALALLIYLQYLIAWLSVRYKSVRRLVKGEPALLFYQGGFIADALLRERVTREEVEAAVRSQGITQMADVGAVVLETDGSLTTMARIEAPPASVLSGVNVGDVGELENTPS